MGKDIPHCPDGLGAVTDAILYLRTQFRKGLPQRGYQKEGVITETFGTARLKGDSSFTDAFAEEVLPPRGN